MKYTVVLIIVLVVIIPIGLLWLFHPVIVSHRTDNSDLIDFHLL